jgi:chromosome partitioning protein
MKIIAVLNQKGGSGKTTTSINLAEAIKQTGKSTLIADSDPQGSVRDWNNATNGECLPVVGLDRPSLAKDIENIKNGYDYIIIDGAPQLSNNMSAAINVADTVIIPVQPSPLDVWACSELVSAIRTKQELGSKIKAFFLISRAIQNTTIAKDVKKAIVDYGIPVLNNYTTQRVVYPETINQGKTIFHSKNKEAIHEMISIKNELNELGAL